MSHKLAKAIASACLSFALLYGAAQPAGARPFGIEDLLRIEAVGQTLVDPTGRWLVIERVGPVADAPRFDTPYQTEILRTRLLKVDLDRPGEAQPVLADDPESGAVALGFSPDGRHLAIGRLRDGAWQLGVTTIASGTTHWFEIAPDYSPYHQSIAWISSSKLVLIAVPKGQLPWYLRFEGAAETDLPRRWADTRAGRPSVTLVGSGRLIDLTAHPASDRLILLDMVDRQATPLATGLFTDLNPAPDGRHVAVIETLGHVHPRSGQRLTVDTDIMRRRLLVVDLAGHIWQPCADCDVNMPSVIWSASSKALAFFVRGQGQEWPAGQLWQADPARRFTRLIPTPDLTPIIRGAAGGWQAIGTAWSGGHILLYAAGRGVNGDRPGWYRVGGSDQNRPAPYYVSALPEIVVDRRSGATAIGGGEAWAVRRGTPHPFLTGMDEIHTDLDGSQGGLWGWKRDGNHLHILLRDRGTRDLDVPVTPLATPVAASTAKASIILQETQPDGVTRLLDASAQGVIPLLTINGRLGDVDPARTIPVRYKMPDSKMVTSWLYLPASSAPGIKPPLIVIPYPGDVLGDAPPAIQAPDSGRLYANAQMLVGHGYAVLVPSMPMLTASATKPYPFADQILAAVDATAALDLVDTGRLGLWGHSFGGFTAATVATETNRFKAIVASSGVYDLTSMRGAFAPATRVHPEYGLSIVAWAGWSETGQAGLGVPPWSEPARYIANSPVFHADQIRTPMMIIAADRDVTPVPQAEELFSALYLQDKDAELLTYWGEGHVVQSPGNVRDLYGRVFHWFDAHLRDPGPAAVTPVSGERADTSPSRACQTRTHCSSTIIVSSSE